MGHPRQAGNADSDAKVPKRRFRFILAGIAAAVAALIAVIALRSTTTSTPFSAPACNESTTVECLRSWTANGQRVQAELSNGDRLDYTIGQPGDVFLTGNWLCGTLATLAIYRPATGVVYYVDSWPRTTDKAITYADATGQRGLTRNNLHIGDHNDDGCADLGLDADGTRTWYLPAVQAKRLRKMEAA